MIGGTLPAGISLLTFSKDDLMQETSGTSFDYEQQIMGIGGIVSLNDYDPVAFRLKRCLEGLGTCSGKVLEIGCGAGRMLKNLKHYCPGIEVYGCDISRNAILKASRDVTEGRFTVADAQNLPYGDGSFDIVLGFDIIEHVPNVGQTLGEICRVLKKEGRFHLHAPCEGNAFTIYWLLEKMGLCKDLKRKFAGHIQQLTSKELIASLSHPPYVLTNVTYSWHLIGQISDLERYVSKLILSHRNHLARGEGNILIRLLDRVLYAFEYLLTASSIIESRLLRHFPWALGTHLSGYKKDSQNI